ncbi:ABC transporter permease [Aquibacillus saliphilus]|uniref:ABC transporter permease n=1 Tax=Aquibacillus saliphilus TaxID=1909422 RepID=UPI001CF08EFD|nr:ABC transporter permease [Aquibacillus saliphilus]
MELESNTNPSLLQRWSYGITKNWLASFAIIILLFLIVMALFPALLTSYAPLEVMLDDVLVPPSTEHIMGTDEYGRDIWSRLVYSARVTIYIGLGSAILAALVGIPLGLLAGYYGGKLEQIIQVIVDTMLSFPAMLLAILIVSAWNPNPFSLIVVISMVNFPRFTMVVRSNVLSLKEREFVMAAKLSGVSSGRIMFFEILPNCMTPIIVQGSLLTATAILIETGLSYFGLGIQPPDPSWGGMLNHAQNYMKYPWYSIAPGLAILLTVLSINIIGDHFRDRLDVRR